MNEMSIGKPAASSRRPSLLRGLDYVPARLAGGLGVFLGVALGALSVSGLSLAASLAPFAPFAAAGVFLALLAGAVALAFSGQPISVIDDAPRPAPVEPAAPATPVEPVEPPQPPQPPRRPSTVALVEIPAGVFRMGSLPTEAGRLRGEGPVHEVHLDRFECMVHPVTRRLYRQVMTQTPDWREEESDEWPANKVSWTDAIKFCNRLSDADGLQRCYDIADEGPVSWNQAADGYRLPTEAEWEYACRAGTETRYSFGEGDDAAELGRHAWYSGNADGHPHAVGGRQANAWGLHDMHGNVWEWCWDWYGPYPAEAQSNPGGPPSGQERVLRGGSFNYGAELQRSASRDWFRPGLRFEGFGFRCVRGPRRQPAVQPSQTIRE